MIIFMAMKIILIGYTARNNLDRNQTQQLLRPTFAKTVGIGLPSPRPHAVIAFKCITFGFKWDKGDKQLL